MDVACTSPAVMPASSKDARQRDAARFNLWNFFISIYHAFLQPVIVIIYTKPFSPSYQMKSWSPVRSSGR